CARLACAFGMPFSARSARCDSMLKRSRAFCRSPVSLRSSLNISGSRMWTMWSTALKNAASSAERKASDSAWTHAPYSACSPAKPPDMLTSLLAENDVELFLEGLRGKRLDHIAVHPGVHGLDDLLPLGFRGEHQHGQLRQLGIGAHR